VSHMSRMRQYRTIWISDVHLGTRGCKADFLIDFLRYNDAETIYLVGDIIDGWRLKRSWYWPQAHNDVVQKVLRKVRKGAQVIYVPGNHDEWLRDYTLMQFGGVDVAEEVIHVTADGRRLLVIHGDMFDAVVKHAAGWRCSVTEPTRRQSGSTVISIRSAVAWVTSIGLFRPI
jgi:UDP-2,3-diacylglucosamine pyrophosphatase LpxH